MEKELKQKCGCACHRDKFGLVHETLCCDNTYGSLEIREVNRIKAELEKAVREEILEEYTNWLCKHNYTDADVYAEEPRAIDRFLEEKNLKQ
jgi:hypothetical protein